MLLCAQQIPCMGGLHKGSKVPLTPPGYCLVGKYPPPRGGGAWVRRWVGGLAPDSSILGHQAPPPPRGGGGVALLLGLGFVKGFEISKPRLYGTLNQYL